MNIICPKCGSSDIYVSFSTIDCNNCNQIKDAGCPVCLSKSPFGVIVNCFCPFGLGKNVFTGLEINLSVRRSIVKIPPEYEPDPGFENIPSIIDAKNPTIVTLGTVTLDKSSSVISRVVKVDLKNRTIERVIDYIPPFSTITEKIDGKYAIMLRFASRKYQWLRIA